MKRIRIVIGSVTYGEKGKAALAARGIPAVLSRRDVRASGNGCAFVLEVFGNYTVPAVRGVLQQAHVRYTEILSEELPML